MSSKKAIENTKPQKLVLKVPVENYYGTGKRKSAIAKVWVFKGTGKVSINKIDAKDFLGDSFLLSTIFEPLKSLTLRISMIVLLELLVVVSLVKLTLLN